MLRAFWAVVTGTLLLIAAPPASRGDDLAPTKQVDVSIIVKETVKVFQEFYLELTTRAGPITIPKGGVVPLQAKTKKPLVKVVNPNDKVAGVRLVQGDPSKIAVLGQRLGAAKLIITDDAGNVETVYVIVVEVEKEN